MTEKFKKKVNHLKNKYKPDKNQTRIPEDIKEFSDCTVFNKNKFDVLEIDSYDIKVIGDVELTRQEEQILKLQPKFCIVERIQEVTFEAALAKLRMEYRKQEENKDLTQEEIENCEELEARCRQVFNPETQEYDSTLRRLIM